MLITILMLFSLEWKPVKGLVLRTEATLSLNWKDQYRFWGALTGEGTKIIRCL